MATRVYSGMHAEQAYPKLLSPLHVGRHELRNRVIMGSMHTRLERLDSSKNREVAFYAARANGGVAMIVTGGHAPNDEGKMEEGGPVLSNDFHVRKLRPIAAAIKDGGAKAMLQILHAGRYAKHSRAVGVSERLSPINPRAVRKFSTRDIERTLQDWVRCAELAAEAGFDGVELMGSEGYLINQFIAPLTNDREDEWGGSLENRCRFPIELTRRVRQVLGNEFLIMYRISAIDLVEGGSSGNDVNHLAREIELAGADILNTGIGWHESRIPTIAYQVPRAAWAFGASRLKDVVAIPVVVSNRVNSPDLAETLLAAGAADLVSLARPLLADPEFVNKAASSRSAEIVPCIACNQSCLDHIFTDEVATCLVNPRACRETDFPPSRSPGVGKIAVVGAGPAGIVAAIEARRRGIDVTLFDSNAEVGGQLRLARRIPGKQEFDSLLSYWRRELALTGVQVRLKERVEIRTLVDGGFEHVVVATGTKPRIPEIPGLSSTNVAQYDDVINGYVLVKGNVVIIGSGGIAHDVAELLCLHRADSTPFSTDPCVEFYREWGVDTSVLSPGGCVEPAGCVSERRICMLSRSTYAVGRNFGKSTGWIIRARLKRRGVRVISGVSYHRIDDVGVHVSIESQRKLFEADTVVICAGQDAERSLMEDLTCAEIPFDLIGGALTAEKLNAARAIEEGTRVAHRL